MLQLRDTYVLGPAKQKKFLRIKIDFHYVEKLILKEILASNEYNIRVNIRKNKDTCDYNSEKA